MPCHLQQKSYWRMPKLRSIFCRLDYLIGVNQRLAPGGHPRGPRGICPNAHSNHIKSPWTYRAEEFWQIPCPLGATIWTSVSRKNVRNLRTKTSYLLCLNPHLNLSYFSAVGSTWPNIWLVYVYFKLSFKVLRVVMWTTGLPVIM